MSKLSFPPFRTPIRQASRSSAKPTATAEPCRLRPAVLGREKTRAGRSNGRQAHRPNTGAFSMSTDRAFFASTPEKARIYADSCRLGPIQ